MRIAGSLASALLLLIPALVSAAPASEHGLIERGILVKRAEKCNAKPPTEKKARERYDNQIKAMGRTTAEAHQSQDACKDDQKKKFADEKNAQMKGLIKTNCITNWTRAKDKRIAANNICSGLGGTIDWGHNNAVSFCEDQIKYWEGQKV